MQIPLEVLLGPVGALGLALVWIWDLRQQRAELRDRLNKVIDLMLAGIQPPK